MMNPLLGGLSALPLLARAETRSISAENPTGGKGLGAQALPTAPDHPARDLGAGWKVRPSISVLSGEVVTLAEMQGPGVIQHIWLTVDPKAFRNCVLRFYWDGETSPSVEAPLGDFFACGHERRTEINSLPVAVCPVGGLNCYWPMPFRRLAHITIENDHGTDIHGLYYQVTYALTDVPAEAACFHAQWRRSVTPREAPLHTILDDVRGRGHYVGTYLAWTSLASGWWGEGEIKFYLDGDRQHPTIVGTGTEDYFGGAWCFSGGSDGEEQQYSTAFLGLPLVQRSRGEPSKFGLYRWHVPDPIRFAADLRVTIQALGWWPDGRFQPRSDDIASMAYWYQTEPHAAFPKLPALTERWAR